MKDYSSRLEHEVKVRTADLTLSRQEAIQCLARAAEMRDDITGKHIIRVGRLAAIISRELGFSEERITAVADVFDALTSKRPYKQAIPIERCLLMMQDDHPRGPIKERICSLRFHFAGTAAA